MITIVLPEWVLWFFAVGFCINFGLQIALIYYKRKINCERNLKE